MFGSAASRLALWGPVLTDGRELPSTRVEIADGHIVALEPGAARQPADVDTDGAWICPGLIDLQLNGAGGADLTAADDLPAALVQVARTLAAHGVTAFCPTIVSSPEDRIIDRLQTEMTAVDGAAEPLGWHVEGPFIDLEHRGVHDPATLRVASREEIERWLAAGPPAIVTLAPEQPGGLAAIEQLTQRGVVVSLGHSGADADCAQHALRTGARMATHLFNAMPPLHHRRPGLVGAVLASDAVVGLIVDGIHVHPLMLDLVVRRCGVERVALVSDALAAAGAPSGAYVLGDQTVLSDERVVRRSDGTLAGSALLLDECLRNVRSWLPDIAPAGLVQMATQTPADLLGLRRKGRLAAGCDADVVVLDRDFNLVKTFVRGVGV